MSFLSPRPPGHHGEKPSETLVRFIVEHALGVRVCCYDDRRGISRPDAIIHRCSGVPLEVVSDPLESDLKLTGALAKIDRRAHFSGLGRGYRVCLKVKARISDLSWLEETLRSLEDPSVCNRVPRETEAYLFISPDDRLPPGEVRFTTGSGGGHRIPRPADVVTAASAILAQKRYADVSRKLDSHGGSERHVVLVVDEEKNLSFSWLREATPGDVIHLPRPEVPTGITHMWVTRRYVPGLTIAWSAETGWQGTTWKWGHPVEALAAWDDPACPLDHDPQRSTP